MGDRDLGEARYRAFLSYSHKDAAAAGRLHRRLEAYRIPGRLAGRETARGPVPARLWPIFRDREELPAATDLSETVREALAQSGALIILCSPHAVGSLWVEEEIRVFRELHPDRPILAAILDGDPPDCFPPLLRAYRGEGHEPLATDLRRHRDGERLGLLKLVAGITGLGLDDLVQRDATRRVRRVMAVTAGAVAAMLVMAVLAVVAITAQREAERQRAAAEGLVEFMLTDLRDRLAGVGNLDVMAAVNARALRYYGQRNVGGLHDDSLARRARILQAIGDDNISRDDLDGALAAFEEAHQTTAEQLARMPGDPRRIFEHAKSELGIGRVHEIRRNWPMAQLHYQACAGAVDRLIAGAPDNPDYMARLASCAVNLGNVQLNGTKDYQAAQRSYQRAVLWLGRAAAARPGDSHLLLSQANAYGWLADSFFVRRLWAQALEARQRQFAIVERLQLGQPANAEFGFRLAAARRGLTYAYFRNAGEGDSARAREHLFRAYDFAVRLTRRDPNNAEWRTLKGLLAYDLLHLGLGLPPDVTSAQLQRSLPHREDNHQ